MEITNPSSRNHQIFFITHKNIYSTWSKWSSGPWRQRFYNSQISGFLFSRDIFSTVRSSFLKQSDSLEKRLWIFSVLLLSQLPVPGHSRILASPSFLFIPKNSLLHIFSLPRAHVSTCKMATQHFLRTESCVGP